MKQYFWIVLGCSLLGACVAHETDLQAAQEKRDAALAQKRAENGCTFIRDHDAYRQCVMNTYYMQHPRTYETHELTNGQPIAVISNQTAGCGCGAVSCTNKVAPLPAGGPQVVPYATSESTTVETTCTQNYQAQEASVTTTEVLPPPPPVQITTQPAPVVEPEPDPTWWETYKAEKKPEPIPQKPVCPCPDPNDPCPQCVDK